MPLSSRVLSFTASLIAANIACLALTAGAASAAPVVRLSWDDCSPIVTDKSWSGPGTYVQVLSVTGLSNGTVRVGGGAVNYFSVPQAWLFDDGTGPPSFCHPRSELDVVATGTSCPPLPATQLDYRIILQLIPGYLGFQVTAQVDPAAVLDPNTRYTIARIAYDQSRSVAGPAAPGQCGGADQPVCFSGFAFVEDASGQRVVPMDSSYLTWQGRPDCFGAVPARAATWGEIKSQYH